MAQTAQTWDISQRAATAAGVPNWRIGPRTEEVDELLRALLDRVDECVVQLGLGGPGALEGVGGEERRLAVLYAPAASI